MRNIRYYLLRIETFQSQNINPTLVLKYIKNEKDIYKLLDVRYTDIIYDDEKIIKTLRILFKKKFNVNYKYENNSYLDLVVRGFKLEDPEKETKIFRYSDEFIIDFVNLLKEFNFKFEEKDGTPLSLNILSKEKRDNLRKLLLDIINKKEVETKSNITMTKEEKISEIKKQKEVELVKKEIITEAKKIIAEPKAIRESKTLADQEIKINQIGAVEKEEPKETIKKTKTKSSQKVIKVEPIIEKKTMPKKDDITIKSIIEPIKNYNNSGIELTKNNTMSIDVNEDEKTITPTTEEEKTTVLNDISELKEQLSLELDNDNNFNTRESNQEKSIEIPQVVEINQSVERKPAIVEKEEISETTLIIPSKQPLKEDKKVEIKKINKTKQIKYTKEDQWIYLVELIEDSSVYNDLIKYLDYVKSEKIPENEKESKNQETMIMIISEYYKENIKKNISLDHIEKLSKILVKTNKKFIKVPFEKEFNRIKVSYLKRLSDVKATAKSANTLVELKKALSLLIEFNDEEAVKKIKRDIEYTIIEMESTIRKNKQSISEIENNIKILRLYGLNFTTNQSLINDYNSIKKSKLETVSQEELKRITIILNNAKSDSINNIYNSLGNNIDRALNVLAILVTAKFINLMAAQNVFGQLVSTYGTPKQKIVHALPIISLTKKIHTP